MMETTNTAIEVKTTPKQTQMTQFDYSFNGDLARAYEFAKNLCQSKLLPESFHGNPASTLIALDYAARVRRNPLEIMQAMYIVHGRPSFSSAFLIALINSCGHYEPLRFKFSEKRDECYAWTKDKRTGEEVRGTNITMQMANTENWATKTGSKWKTMPELMLQYRAAAFFYRVNCPDLMGSFQTAEELNDVDYEQGTGAKLSITPTPEQPIVSASKSDRLAGAIGKKNTTTVAPPEPPVIDVEPEPESPAQPEIAPSEPDHEAARAELVSLLKGRGYFDEKARKALFKRVLKDPDAKTITMSTKEINRVIDAIYAETA